MTNQGTEAPVKVLQLQTKQEIANQYGHKKRGRSEDDRENKKDRSE